MRWKRSLLTVAVVCLAIEALAASAQAWSDAGHKIVASIAFRRLTPAERTRIVALLKQHPRFQKDFADRMPQDVREADAASQEEWIFQQASVWPDIARGFEGEAREKYHKSTWHYINQPLYLTEADRAALEKTLPANVSFVPPETPRDDMNIVQTLRVARKIVANKEAPAEERAVFLSWIFHLVGDIHQPMHSTAAFSRRLFPEGDKGGNLVKTKQQDNLHALWDRFPGGFAKLGVARNKAIALGEDPALSELGAAAAADLNEETWLEESRRLAVEKAYDAEVLGPLRAMESDASVTETRPITLSEDYLSQGGKIAERRLVQAGFRLGAILKSFAE